MEFSEFRNEEPGLDEAEDRQASSTWILTPEGRPGLILSSTRAQYRTLSRRMSDITYF